MVSKVMGKTLAEKILSENSESDARAGDIVVAKVGLAFLQDGTGPLALKQLLASGLDRVTNSEGVVLSLDHASPSPNRELSNDQLILRYFAPKYGTQHGICHQIIVERHANPDAAIVVYGDIVPEPCAGLIGGLGLVPGASRVEKAIAQIIAEGKSASYDMKPNHTDPPAVGASQVADAVT